MKRATCSAARRRRSLGSGRRFRPAEIVARALITAGGLGTVAAVAAILVFLVWVVAPLFIGASIEAHAGVGELALGSGARPLHLSVDDSRLLCAVYRADGTVDVLSLEDGALLDERALFDGRAPSASSFALEDGACAFGFEDGSVALLRVAFGVEFLGESEEQDPALAALQAGETAPYRGGIALRTPAGQLRWTRLEVRLEHELSAGGGEPIRALDYAYDRSASALAVRSGEHRVAVFRMRERRNLLTGKVSRELDAAAVPTDMLVERGPPEWMRLGAGASQLYFAWRDGHLVRFDTRPAVEPRVAEELDLVEPNSDRLTALEFLIGRKTLVTGDSAGRVRAWFGTKPAGASTPDGLLLQCARELPPGANAVTALAPSPRSRLVAAGFAGGGVSLYHVTSESRIARAEAEGVGAVERLAIAPAENGLAAVSGGRILGFTVDAMHPEASLAALFRPVWYEGYERPEHVWQSSSGTDEFEPKLGLYPLVYGTVKATFYSMLFGVPLALLAAVYTSELMHSRWKSIVKSVIEMMASLPSVVLGFLAAIVIAPFVQEVVPAAIAAFLTVPLAFLSGAYLWQMLPRGVALRMEGAPRVAVLCLMLLAGLGAARLGGPLLEQLLFSGDVAAWLDGQVGSGRGGWLLLVVPPALLAVAALSGQVVNPRLRSISVRWTHRQCALADVAKFLALLAATLLLAVAVSTGLDRAGLDPRGTFLGTYVQRNALVVGFVMGFAVIPIVYTLAEDALSSVPQHLRLASLAAGATTWQTAVRIVIPTAMSGLFSAVMIGLGRAVGETMIVLMATGNTPVMEWNVFNGFRTLSANIAVELPEAVRNSTQYRTLFLASLALFSMTFAVNTVAEVVRQRFRRRAFEL